MESSGAGIRTRAGADAVSKELEEWIESTLIAAMAQADKQSEKTAAANVAVRYLAVKHRVGPALGTGFDDDSE